MDACELAHSSLSPGDSMKLLERRGHSLPETLTQPHCEIFYVKQRSTLQDLSFLPHRNKTSS
jgi:hypothetical protein